MRPIHRRLRLWLMVLGGTYLAICLALFALQRSMLFPADTSLANPADVELGSATLEQLKTADGEDLVAWWIPPRGSDKPVYLYLHGNGGNLSYRPHRFVWLSDDGSGVLAVSWRGYGGSTGSPTEGGLMTDARTAYAVLRSRVGSDRIVLFGESLGPGIAVKLAAEAPVAALILDSAYSSIADVAASKFSAMPVRWLLRDEFRADLTAEHVSAPVFQVHCVDDPVIPIEFARRLNVLFPVHAALIEVPGVCHPISATGFAAVMEQFKAGAFRPD